MSDSTFKRFAIPTALVVGGVTVGSFVAPIGLASAADDDTSDTTDGTATVDGADADDRAGSEGHRHGRRGGDRFGPKAEVLEEAIGLGAEEIRDGLADGKTLAEIAAEQGVSSEELTAALVDAATERIDQALADGRIDEDRAAEAMAALDERIEEMINRVPPEDLGEGDRHGRRGRGGPLHGGGEVLQEVLGLTSEEIKAGLDDGKSLADLAEEQGVSTDDVAAAMVAAATERIDGAVESGKLDADRAEEAKANLEEMIAEAIEAEPFDLGRGVGRGEGRGLRQHHRFGHHGDQGADPGDTADTGLST